MMRKWLKSATLAGFAVTALGSQLSAQISPRMAEAGTVNYIEGEVLLNGSDLTKSGSMNPAILRDGQVLTVQDGKAEVLLSPGVFIRAGRNSELRMVSSDMVDPRVELTRGEAIVEVDPKLKNERVDVTVRGVDATVLKNGLYRFDGDKGLIAVIDGKLSVPENGKAKEIGKGKEFLLTGDPAPQVAGFDAKAEDDLYIWSRTRSGYMAEVNASTARSVYGGYAPFAGAGWYWSPYFTSWAWLPGDGFFYSPFGYPFFSPAYVAYAPFYRGGFAYRGGFYARGGAFRSSSAGIAGFGGAAAGFRGGSRR